MKTHLEREELAGQLLGMIKFLVDIRILIVGRIFMDHYLIHEKWLITFV
jgi:hypothetical protein